MNSSGNRVNAGSVAFFLLWCAGFAYLAWRHVPWRDELQSWLIVTRTQSWDEFFTAINYERQPPLYYLLLVGVKQLGAYLLPFVPQWKLPLLFSWAFSAANVALLIFAFRAPRWIRFGVPLGIIMLLEYGLVARCYSLATFFLLLAAYYYNQRSPTRVWCALALCANFHLYFGWIALILFFFSLYDFRKHPALKDNRALAILCFLTILGTFATMLPPRDSAYPTDLNYGAISFKALTSALAFALTGLDSFSEPYRWNANAWSGWSGLWIWPALLLAARSGFSVWRFLLISFVPLLLYAGVERFYFRYLAAIFMVSLFLELTSLKIPRRFPVYAIFVFSLVFMSGKWLWHWQPWNPASAVAFSAAQELVDSQEALLKQSRIYAITAVPHLFSVMARVDHPLDVYDIGRKARPLYPFFTKGEEWMGWKEWCTDSRAEAVKESKGQPVLLVLPGRQSCPRTCRPTSLVFQSTLTDLADEAYTICQLREPVARFEPST